MKDKQYLTIIVSISVAWLVSAIITVNTNHRLRKELTTCRKELTTCITEKAVVTDTVFVMSNQPVMLQGEDGTTPYLFSYEANGILINEVVFRYTDESAISFGRTLAIRCDMVEVSKGDFVIYRKVKTSEHGY